MFVSETSLSFMGTRLSVLSAEGRLWEGQIDPSTTVEAMKKIVFAYFYPEEVSLGPDNFRVILPRECRSLGDTVPIIEEHLQENDMLLFIRRRSANPPDVDNNLLDLKAPTAAEIWDATKELAMPPLPTPKPNSIEQGPSFSFRRPGHNNHTTEDSTTVETSVDFQLELRKIIISLVSVMATLLHSNTDADLICQQIHARLKRRLAAKNAPVEGTSFRYATPPEIVCSPLGIVGGLAEVRKREFRPNVSAMESLKEMGFKDEEILEALRATRNSKDAAAEWLAAGKKQTDDPEAGLDPHSHLFSALVSAPTIRLGLSNPKTLLAFLNILESPAAATVWLNDTDTAPVLTTIFKIYHAEKHAAPES